MRENLLCLKACLTSYLSIEKHVVPYVRLKSPTQAVWYQSKQPVVTIIPSTGHHNHSYITSQHGNILIPAAIVFTGGSYESMKQFSNALNLNFVNKDQFNGVQDKIVFPVIDNAYEKQQKDVIETLKEKKTSVDLCGDGRSDSPGHNAEYGTYSLMDEATGHIIDFSLVQVSEVSSSNAMENEGCQRSLKKVMNQNVKIRSLATDRHTTITAEMRKKYPSIIHQYDVWHLS